MNRRLVNGSAAVLAAFALVGLWWFISYILIRTIPQLLHSRVETGFAALTILLMWVAILSGALIGAQTRRHVAPRKHRISFLHFRLHH